MAKRYKVRPSELLNGDIDDFQIDFLCFEVGVIKDKKANQNQNNINKNQKLPRLKKI
jgi:hypothetical protein